MSDKLFKIKAKGVNDFQAENFDIPDEGMTRFVISSKNTEDDSYIEQVKYIPIANIISIDGYEEYVDEEEEEELEEEIEMTKED